MLKIYYLMCFILENFCFWGKFIEIMTNTYKFQRDEPENRIIEHLLRDLRWMKVVLKAGLKGHGFYKLVLAIKIKKRLPVSGKRLQISRLAYFAAIFLQKS